MRVLCDVDGVLAQWKVVFRKHLADVGFEIDNIAWNSPDLPLTKAEREYAWMKMSEPGVACDLEPLPGAIEGVKKIAKIADVYFVTAQVERSRTWVYDRENWLIKHFGQELGSKVVNTHYKYLVKGDMLIDDKEYNMKAWKKAFPGGIGVLWDHPHNQNYNTVGVRMSDWYEPYKAIMERGR